MDVGKSRRHAGQSGAGQGQVGRVGGGEGGEDVGQHLAQEGHDREVVVDKAELDVEADVFVEVAGGVVRLGAKDRPDLKDALEDADHDLLVELGALRQVGLAAEVVDGEDVGPALGGGGDQLGRLDLGEALAVEAGAEGAHHGGGEAEDGAAGGVAVYGDGVVELGGEGGVELHALGEQRGRALGDPFEHGDGGVVDFDAAGGLGGGDGDAFNCTRMMDSSSGSAGWPGSVAWSITIWAVPQPSRRITKVMAPRRRTAWSQPWRVTGWPARASRSGVRVRPAAGAGCRGRRRGAGYGRHGMQSFDLVPVAPGWLGGTVCVSPGAGLRPVSACAPRQSLSSLSPVAPGHTE